MHKIGLCSSLWARSQVSQPYQQNLQYICSFVHSSALCVCVCHCAIYSHSTSWETPIYRKRPVTNVSAAEPSASPQTLQREVGHRDWIKTPFSVQGNLRWSLRSAANCDVTRKCREKERQGSFQINALAKTIISSRAKLHNGNRNYIQLCIYVRSQRGINFGIVTL